MGYGPLRHDGKTVLSKIQGADYKRTAIDQQSRAGLTLMVPENRADELSAAVLLASWFGTLGSRSRNGWGSLHIEGSGIQARNTDRLRPFLRPLSDCLSLDWPHAIGSDEKGFPLVWKTETKNSWREAMKEMARIKIAFRTQFKFINPGFNERHLLAYPVTHHMVNEWGNQVRLANQIRFKTAKTGEKFIGIIAHLPCRLPDALASRLHGMINTRSTWQAVHAVLDQNVDRI